MYRIRKSDLNTVIRVLGPLSYIGWGVLFVYTPNLSTTQLAKLTNAGVQVW